MGENKLNNNVTLWRGLGYDNKGKVSLDTIKNNLLSEGDVCEDKAWLLVPTIEHHDYNVDLIINNSLNESPNIERYGTKKSKYVCGDTIGADFYATREYGIGVVVKINAEITRLVIDGRDFLYYAIPKIIKEGTSNRTKDIFEKAFGKKSRDYLEKGKMLQGASTNLIFKFVDYFCMDLEIIDSNLKSDVLICGRYETKFKGAFGIIDGIKPEDIVDIIEPGSNVNASYNYKLNIRDL